MFLDCGNTAVKCRVDDKVTTFCHQDHDFDVKFQTYLHQISGLSNVVMANVCDPQKIANFEQLIKQLESIEIIKAQTESSYLQLKNGYHQIEQLGVDRWLAMIASQSIEGDKVIVDVGSWIKADIVKSTGEHLGGVIISHTQKDEASLFQRFDLEPSSCKSGTALLGQSTAQCLCASFGQYGEQALIHWLDQVISKPVTLLLTGGGATHLKKLSEYSHVKENLIKRIHFQENLVLSGLSIRYPN